MLIRRTSLITTSLLCSTLSAQFATPRVLQAQEAWRPASTGLADLDSDGDPDAFANSVENAELFWFENDGTGAFNHRHTVIPPSTQRGSSMAAADLDGDGDVDFAGTPYALGPLEWLPNQGTGAFGAPITIAHDTIFLYSIAINDMDDDGVQDLVITMSWFDDGQLNTGTYWYSFPGGAVVEHVVLGPEPTPPYRTSVVDINGDGNLDVLAFDHAWSDPQGMSLQVLGDGSGGFNAPEPFLPAPWRAKAALCFDVDSDGDTDILAAFPVGDSAVTMRLGFFANTGGTLLPPIILDTLAAPLTYDWLCVMDIDDDGDPDAVISDPQRLAILRNEGGSLSLPQDAKPALYSAFQRIDVDGDGAMDLSTAMSSGSALGWFKNLGGGEYDVLRPIGRGLACASQDVSADLDMDGRKDIVVPSYIDSRIAWFKATPSGQFDPYRLIDAEATLVNLLIVGDDDGDGDPDILASLKRPSRIARYANDGVGNFGTPVPVVEPDTEVQAMHVSDVDDDGALDLVYSAGMLGSGAYWARHIGPGQYGQPQLIDTTHYVMRECLPAFIDADSILDVAMCSMNDHHIFWRKGQGGGVFGPRQTIASTLPLPTNLEVLDLDGDGDPDLLASSIPAARVMWFPNDGNGVFGPGTLIFQDQWDMGACVTADIDLDGDKDIAILYEDYGDSLAWFRNDGAGSFGQRIVPTGAEYLRGGLTPLDIDADGDPDLVYTNGYEANLKFMENLVHGGYTIHGTLYEDLDHDGVHDDGEPGMPQVHVMCTPAATAPITNEDGSYTFYLPAGTYSIGVQNVPPNWGLSSDSSLFHITLDAAHPSADQIDIGFAPTLDTTIIDVRIEPIAGPCGDPTVHNLCVLNRGTTRPNGIIRFDLDDNYQWQNATPPRDSLVAGIRYWHFDTIGYMQQCRIMCHVISPSPEFILDPDGMSTLDVILTDDLGNATDTISTALLTQQGCAFDPNDKQVEPKGYGALGAVPMSTDRLIYTIHFQNTGVGPAFNIIVRDPLPPALDPSSFHLLAWSHTPNSIDLEPDGDLMVRFNGILLPDSGTDRLASNGFITFAIDVLEGLSSGTAIDNQAEIHFDNQPGILTNMTHTTLRDCDEWVPIISASGPGALEATDGDSYQWFLDGMLLPNDTVRTLILTGPGSFTVEVTSHLGCEALSTPFIVGTTSVNGPNGAPIAVYPVPFSTETHVLLDQPLTSTGRIELIDACGRVRGIWHGDGRKDFTINRKGLTSGLYLVRVSTSNVIVATCRVVID